MVMLHIDRVQMREEYQLQIITPVETLIACEWLSFRYGCWSLLTEALFLQGVEYNCKVRPALKMPMQMGPLPEDLIEKIGEPGEIPNLAELGLKYREQVCEL